MVSFCDCNIESKSVMEKVSLESYAKVNLTLQIINKRSDGYHNISTIFQEIDLNDKIIMEKKESGCNFSTNVNWLNNDSSNLCIKAWKRMAEAVLNTISMLGFTMCQVALGQDQGGKEGKTGIQTQKKKVHRALSHGVSH